MPNLISVFNMKGGIGKSTVSANVAAGLSKIGTKVLLINADGQNNSLRMLNPTFSLDKSIFDLTKEHRDSISEVAFPLMENVDGIPSHRLSELNKVLVLNEDNLLKVFSFIFPAAEIKAYDYVIFDLGPGENHINTMILKASDSMILPVQAEFESTDAIFNTFDYLNRIGVSRDLIKLVVPNMVDRKSISRQAVNALSEIFDQSLISTPIPRRSDVNYASANGINIFDYSADATVTGPFYDIVTKIIEKRL